MGSGERGRKFGPREEANGGFVTNQPYMLYETVELLRAFVNETDPEDLTMEGEFASRPRR